MIHRIGGECISQIFISQKRPEDMRKNNVYIYIIYIYYIYIYYSKI